MAEPFAIEDEPLPGLFVLRMPRFVDDRGVFLKAYHLEQFKAMGFDFVPAEQFLSRSSAGVLRGMHFQIGASAHTKLVTCPIGRVLDVVVDVRRDSSQYNRPFSIELCGETPRALLIGKGYAHGFLSLSESSWMQYMTSTVHDPDNDAGVHWSSIDFNWPCERPILSPRDASHPSINDISCEFS